jgi:hypothetical protein
MTAFIVFPIAFIAAFSLVLPNACYDLADACRNERWWSLFLWASSVLTASGSGYAVWRLAGVFER